MGTSPTRLREIFLNALEAEDQAEFLDEACGHDAKLRGRLEELLRSHELAGDFLTPANFSDVSLEATTAHEGPGTTIDRYTLIEPIGEGGFGDVYRAEQTRPIRREVALKIIKLGMDTRQVIARFEAERQALALMDHPGIAKVYDAGATETGRPYFVMELVQGVAITEYCDQNKLTASDRLRLFIDVCGAVQHAHQKGIIHRDIKPTNVMVTLQDGRPLPKIIDFGIAKATQKRLTEKTVFTEHHQLLGTPEYMSPEQAEFSDGDVDTRSDIYSLGVLLYELLVGTPPFDFQDLRGHGYDEICRTIRETDPPTPSRRLNTLGERINDVVQHRQVQQRVLRNLLRGDLDWIVMKCLEKDRVSRYATAQSLADELQRFLDNKPIQAKRPSPVDRMVKWSRRHETVVWSTLGVSVFAAILLVISIGLLVNSYRAETTARQQAEKAVERERQQRLEAERHFYLAQMRLAQHDLQRGQIGRLHDVLDRHIPLSDRPDLRGWEWYYFLALCHDDLLTLYGHAGRVASVSWSSDGQRLASLGSDALKTWDAATGKELLSLRGQSGPVPLRGHFYVAPWSPDGRRLAAADEIDDTIHIWDSDTGDRLLTLRGHTDSVKSIAWSPDGTQLASASTDATVKVWDITTGQEVHSITQAAWFVTWSPDGQRLASAGAAGIGCKIWDVLTGREVLALSNEEIFCVAWSPEGERLAATSFAETWIWDAVTGEEVLQLPGHDGPVVHLAWRPDGLRLASASRDQTIGIWDTSTGQRTRILRGHTGWVLSVAWRPDGQRLATASQDGTIKVWDPGSEQVIRHFNVETRSIDSAAQSPDGMRIATRDSTDESVTVWDVAKGAALTRLHPHTDLSAAPAVIPRDDNEWLAGSVRWSPNGRLIASTNSKDGTTRIWDATTGQEMLSLGGGAMSSFDELAWSPDGRLLASSGLKLVKIWDTLTARELFSLRGHERQILKVAWSPKGRRLASASWDGTVRMWDAATGEPLLTMRGHTPGKWITSLVWSPNGRRLASAGWDQHIKIWNTDRGQEMLTLRGHTAPVEGVAWSPDGQRLASIGWDGIKIWDPTEAREIITLLTGRSHLTRGILAFAWSEDSRKLSVVGGDGEVTLIQVWDASRGYEFVSSPMCQQELARKKSARAFTHCLHEATSAIARKQYSEARGQLQKCAQLTSKDGIGPQGLAAAYTSLGIALLEAGKADEADTAFGEAVVFDSRRYVADRCRALARFLTNPPNPAPHDAGTAVELAKRAAQLAPRRWETWNTLGVANYRAGDWQAAIRALDESRRLLAGGNSYDWFFLAMAHWQLGDKQEARRWYDQAIEGMEENEPQDEQLRRLRAEAIGLLEPGTAASAEKENQERSSK